MRGDVVGVDARRGELEAALVAEAAVGLREDEERRFAHRYYIVLARDLVVVVDQVGTLFSQVGYPVWLDTLCNACCCSCGFDGARSGDRGSFEGLGGFLLGYVVVSRGLERSVAIAF